MLTPLPVYAAPSKTIGVVSCSILCNGEKSLPRACKVCRCPMSHPTSAASQQTPQLTSRTPRCNASDMIPFGFPLVNTASQCFLAGCRHHYQKLNPLFQQLMQEGFASLLLECPVADGINRGVCTWWLWGLTGPQSTDILAMVILGSDGPTMFRAIERGEGVQYQHSYN